MADRETVQTPKRNPLIEALFNSLDAIPQAMQGAILNSGLGSNIGIAPPRPTPPASAPVQPQIPAQAQPQQAQGTPPALSQIPQQFAQQAQGSQPEGGGILDIIKQLAVPAVATGVGLGVPGALPGATGFLEGFQGEKEKRRLEAREDKEKGILSSRKEEKARVLAEEKRIAEAYRTAIDLSKTGPLGGIREITPQQLDSLAKEILKLRSPGSETTKEITDRVVEKNVLNKPSQIPQADWDAATKDQKIDFLQKTGQL